MRAAITITAHISRRAPIQFQMASPTSPPASTRQKTSVTHLADAVARRVRIGLTADPAEADDGAGTNGTRSCDGGPRSQAHPKLVATPKTTPDARALTRAQPPPALLALATIA